jgi:diguanylate cyclase (GGDEF)-like protein
VTPYGASDPEHFSAMVRKFAQEGNVHEEDLDKYYSQTTPEHIRDWLQKGNTGELLVYRRKVEDAYRWTAIEIWPGEDSADGEEHITVMVRDVHQAYNRQLTQRQQVEQFAMTDPMTGLRNRLAYTKCCQDYADRLNRHSVGIIFADVNGLKFVNDNYGHQNGDEYLLTFATELQNLYGCEHCYRLSGDEFLVVMEHYTKIHFAELFAKLQEFLWSQPSPMASVGACWEEAPADIEHLVQKAERVMYSDKQYYYQKYHHTTRENLGNYDAMEFSIEQILSAHAEEAAAAGQEQLDTTGLSSHIFDVFAGTTKRSYLFLENLETRVSRWSKKAVEDFELPGEYVYDVNGVWLERVHPEDRAHYMQEVNDLFTGRKSRFNLNYRARNAQGKYVVCAGEACMIRGQGDKPDYFAGTITNYGIPDTVDRVTNLPSETAFLQRLHEMTEDETTSTVMMVVIDMFSSINGLYGMQTGEEILRIFGENLQRLVGDAG